MIESEAAGKIEALRSLSDDERQGLADVVRMLEQTRFHALLEHLPNQRDTGEHLATRARAILPEVSAALRDLCGGNPKPTDALVTRLAEAGLRAGVETGAWIETSQALRRELVHHIVAEYATRPERLTRTILGMDAAIDRIHARVVATAYELKQREIATRLCDAEQALAQVQNRYARLAESGIIGVLVCDLAGNIREANDCFLSMVGYTREELLSGQVRWSEMTPPEWRHLDEDAVAQLKVQGVTRTWEKEYICKDGTRVPILLGVAMLNDTECIAFVLDITERRHMEELRRRSLDLEAQNRRVQEASRLKSEFLANMSHELRTPLNSIIGFADLLYDGEVEAGSARHREFLGDILTSGRHLLQLINDVLDLAKVESGKLEFRAEQIMLSDTFREVIAVLRTTANTKRIRVELDVEPAVDQVVADAGRLKQVLYNYVSNALKFTPESGHVTVRARAEHRDMFRVEVEDTGIGIAESDFARLFVEFQQLDAGLAKKHAGTGLGLALTKRIVEAQGGYVGVRSRVGSGSVFWATLPRELGVAVATIVADDETRIREGAALVLVIEDDPRDRTLLVQSLDRAGYSIETASTGKQALEACAGRAYDAITLDLLLPDMTGLDVLHQVRSVGRNRATPVVVISVVAEAGVVGGFSVHDYLRKPIQGSDVLGSLQRAGVGPERRGKILVVDDDESALKLMSTVLAQLEYRVECMQDGESALEWAQQERPLAIILDLMMPTMDGFEFLTRFRQDPAHESVPVIVWTFKDLDANDHETLRRHAQAVIAKGQPRAPMLVDELRRVLSATLPSLSQG